MSNSLQPHGLKHSRLFCPWGSPGKNTGVGSYSVCRETFPTQGLNPGLLHWRQIVYHLSHQGSPLVQWLFVDGEGCLFLHYCCFFSALRNQWVEWFYLVVFCSWKACHVIIEVTILKKYFFLKKIFWGMQMKRVNIFSIRFYKFFLRKVL